MDKEWLKYWEKLENLEETFVQEEKLPKDEKLETAEKLYSNILDIEE